MLYHFLTRLIARSKSTIDGIGGEQISSSEHISHCLEQNKYEILAGYVVIRIFLFKKHPLSVLKRMICSHLNDY